MCGEGVHTLLSKLGVSPGRPLTGYVSFAERTEGRNARRDGFCIFPTPRIYGVTTRVKFLRAGSSLRPGVGQ